MAWAAASISDDGKPTGLPNVREAIDQISELVKVRIEPAVHVILEPLQAEGKDILRVHVAGGADTPYYYSGDGNKIAYYRVGNESVPVPASILNEASKIHFAQLLRRIVIVAPDIGSVFLRLGKGLLKHRYNPVIAAYDNGNVFYTRAFISENIAESVFGYHHIEERRLLYHSHRSVVHIHKVGRYIGILRSKLLPNAPP